MKTFRLLDPVRPSSIPGGHCALAVMTKAPRAGHVKTRLVPPLTADEAAELNKCFLRDTAGRISSATKNKEAGGIAVYTPIGAESAYDDILPGDFSLLPQREGDFGERLWFAAQDLFRCGFDSVCLIDSDSPTVPAENFSKAIELLKPKGDRILLGPCDDGGYYLIGLKKPHRALFEQIDWSTKRVFDQTLHRAREINLEVQLLPTGYDIDDAAGLRRLRDELLVETISTNIAPHTREFLANIVASREL